MWIIFALLSPAVYTITNFVDKYLLSNKVKDYNALPIYTAGVSFIFGLIWWLFAGLPTLPTKDAGIIIFTGIVTIFSIYVYLKALSIQETSMVILLFQLSPVFTLILSFFFLSETITLKQYLGFGLTLGGTSILALPNKKTSWTIPKGFWSILIYDLMFALISIFFKYTTYEISFSQMISYESFGVGIGGLMMYLLVPTVRNAFIKSKKKLFKQAFPIIVINEIIFIIAKSLGYYAFVIGPVTLVSVIANVQVFFGLLFGYGLTVMMPKFFYEDISTEKMVLKSVAAIFMFIGLGLMV